MSRRILLVEDQVLFRKALKQILGQSREQRELFEVGSPREALSEIKATEFDLVITDLCFPQEDGLWLLSKLNESASEVPVLVVTASGRPELLRQAVEMGARGCLPKSSDPSQLLVAVERLLMGQSFFPLELSNTERRLPRLNARALEVLCHSHSGIGPDEIQRRMGLSSETYSSLVRGICRKLSAESVTSAAARAYSLGLIAGADHG
ncbi:MAG: response regulator transcription factor [Candidatus Eremiobacteraeota bacterium]|nr:response regulator transcription factor [Candidatus Eremiobacteraeota bacterium]